MRIILSLLLLIPAVAFSQEQPIDSIIIHTGECKIITATKCDIPTMKDNVVAVLIHGKYSNEEKIKVLENSIIAPIKTLIGDPSDIDNYIVGDLMIEFREGRARISLSQMRIFKSYKYYTSFNKYESIQDFCYENEDKYLAQYDKYTSEIIAIEKRLDTKLSKKERKDIMYKLDCTKASLKLLESTHDNNVRFGKTRDREKFLSTFSSFADSIKTSLTSCEDW